jgi:hypothetical protein
VEKTDVKIQGSRWEEVFSAKCMKEKEAYDLFILGGGKENTVITVL